MFDFERVFEMQYDGKLPQLNLDPLVEAEHNEMLAYGLNPYVQADRDAFYEATTMVSAEASGMSEVVITGGDELTVLSRRQFAVDTMKFNN